MSIPNWRIQKVSPAGGEWAVTITGTGGNAFDNSLFLNSYFNKGSGSVSINDVPVTYMGHRISSTDSSKAFLKVEKRESDYHFFPPFLSWNWDLRGDIWYATGSLDDAFSQTSSGSSIVDPFERSASPYNWHITNTPYIAGGTPADYYLEIGESNGLSQSLNHAFINTFYQSGCSIFVDDGNFTVTSGYINGESGAHLLATDYLSSVPDAEDPVYVATYNSRIALTGKTATELSFHTNQIGNQDLKVFYDFRDYENFHIKSEAPAAVFNYSGTVYGDMDQFNNITTTGQGVFDRNNYIKLDNTTGLFSKEYTFLFSYEKTDQKSATIFNNFGGFTYPTSGFEFGINSANKLYYECYSDSLPLVCSLETHNAAKGIYYVQGQDNTVDLGVFNLNREYFDSQSFEINDNFIRESYDWYIGTGTYNCDGYLDKFMYFDKALTRDELTLVAQSFTKNVTGIPDRIRVTSASITGYSGHISGVTGLLGYTGILSGVIATAYSGYNVTGSGITGLENIQATYSMFLTGDAYTGLHLYSNLDQYELYKSGDAFWQITGTSSQKEISSIAYNPFRETLFVNNSDNANTFFSELNQGGGLVRVIETNFQEIEGMCYMSGKTFAVADESEGKLYYGDIHTSTTGIVADDWSSITITPPESWGNTGIEGVTFDSGNNCFYVCQEGDESNPSLRPPKVLKVDFDGTTEHMFDAQHLADDLSDIFYDHNTSTFYLLSDASQKVIQASTGGRLLYEKDLSFIPWTNHQAEGITFSDDMNQMFLASERDNGAIFNYNSALQGTYELLRSYTGFYSGDYEYSMDFYLRSPLTGMGVNLVTGFFTGLQAYEYTGYQNVYIPSGITGYLYSGYSYTPLSGRPDPYYLSFLTGNLIATNEIYDYFFNSIGYIGYRGQGERSVGEDYFEYITRSFNIYDDGNYDFDSVNDINRFADFGYNPKLSKYGFSLAPVASTGRINVFFDGLAQHEGLLETTQNTLYEEIPSVLSGDFALSGFQVLGTAFDTTRKYQDEVLYDVNQPSYDRYEVEISEYDQWVAPKSYDLGINPHNTQIFINGQKIYSGIDYYAEPEQARGEDFHGSGFVTGITGNLMTFPQVTGSYNISGASGVYDIKGVFLPDNIYYMNGIRQDPRQFIVYCSGVGLITGTGVGIGRDAQIFYHKNNIYFDENYTDQNQSMQF